MELYILISILTICQTAPKLSIAPEKSNGLGRSDKSSRRREPVQEAVAPSEVLSSGNENENAVKDIGEIQKQETFSNDNSPIDQRTRSKGSFSGTGSGYWNNGAGWPQQNDFSHIGAFHTGSDSFRGTWGAPGMPQPGYGSNTVMPGPEYGSNTVVSQPGPWSNGIIPQPGQGSYYGVVPPPDPGASGVMQPPRFWWNGAMAQGQGSYYGVVSQPDYNISNGFKPQPGPGSYGILQQPGPGTPEIMPPSGLWSTGVIPQPGQASYGVIPQPGASTHEVMPQPGPGASGDTPEPGQGSNRVIPQPESETYGVMPLPGSGTPEIESKPGEKSYGESQPVPGAPAVVPPPGAESKEIVKPEFNLPKTDSEFGSADMIQPGSILSGGMSKLDSLSSGSVITEGSDTENTSQSKKIIEPSEGMMLFNNLPRETTPTQVADASDFSSFIKIQPGSKPSAGTTQPGFISCGGNTHSNFGSSRVTQQLIQPSGVVPPTPNIFILPPVSISLSFPSLYGGMPPSTNIGPGLDSLLRNSGIMLSLPEELFGGRFSGPPFWPQKIPVNPLLPQRPFDGPPMDQTVYLPVEKNFPCTNILKYWNDLAKQIQRPTENTPTLSKYPTPDKTKPTRELSEK